MIREGTESASSRRGHKTSAKASSTLVVSSAQLRVDRSYYNFLVCYPSRLLFPGLDDQEVKISTMLLFSIDPRYPLGDGLSDSDDDNYKMIREEEATNHPGYYRK